MLTKVELEIDVPEGYEVVRYGLPKEGEVYLAACRKKPKITKAFRDYEVANKIILQPIWQWPAWLKAPWIAMDEDRTWYVYEDKPHISRDTWINVNQMNSIEDWAIDFTPPPCTDWTKSLRKNPHLEN